MRMLHIMLLSIYISLMLMVILCRTKTCLPYFGKILYLIFGSTVAIKLTAFIRRKKLQMQPDNVELLSPVSLEEGHLSASDLQVIF